LATEIVGGLSVFDIPLIYVRLLMYERFWYSTSYL